MKRSRADIVEPIADQSGEDLVVDVTPSAADLREQLARVIAERDGAVARIADLEAFEDENVLDASDEELDRNAEEIVRRRRQVQRLEKVAERLADKIRVADDGEAEERRRATYQAAAAAQAEGQAWVVDEYARHAAAIGAGLVRLVAIDAQLESANADRPAGAPMLQLEGFRALPATDGETTYRDEVAYFDETGGEVRQSEATPVAQDTAGGFWAGADGSRRRVFARTIQVPDHRPGRQRVEPRPLASAVRLPGVGYADTDHWPQRSKAWGPA